MSGYYINIQEETINNSNFRKVLFTGQHTQLVVMSLKPGEEIGMEVHPAVDQFFRVEQGQAQVTIDGQDHHVKDDDAFIVPAGAQHNVVNNGEADLKLYTLYSPPNHPDNTIHATKAEADAYEKQHH